MDFFLLEQDFINLNLIKVSGFCYLSKDKYYIGILWLLENSNLVQSEMFASFYLTLAYETPRHHRGGRFIAIPPLFISRTTSPLCDLILHLKTCYEMNT